jgi:hypothetical protein
MVTRQGGARGQGQVAGAGGRSRRQEQEAQSRRHKQKEGTTNMNSVVPFSFSRRLSTVDCRLSTVYCLLPPCLTLWRLALSFWLRSSAPSVSLYAGQNAWPLANLASRCRSGGRELHLPCRPRDIRRYNPDDPISRANRAATPKGQRRSNPCLPSGHSRFYP